MNIRALQPSDFEPLHALYNSLASLIPHHPQVALKQFEEQLLCSTSDKQPHAFLPKSNVAFVVEQEGRPVALAIGGVLQEDGVLSSMKAGTGVVHFFFAASQHNRECRATIRAVVEHCKSLGATNFRALTGYYGPPFHNNGGAALNSAWPWLGQCLVREGFQTRGLPSLGLVRSLESPLEPLALPENAQLRDDWVTCFGIRDQWEYGHHLFIGDERAGEVMCYYGEKFVRGVGCKTVYVFWLGVNDGFRGRGIGRILLRQALITAQQNGVEKAFVRTGSNNFDALAIYRAEGFVTNDTLWEFEMNSG